MEMTECFLVLGIEPTREEKLIKNAYRNKLTATNPEDDPEGFKRLRAAYEGACAYASRQEQESAGEKRDETPSGLWLERAAQIYGNIRTRRDADLWQSLFDDDVFLSLEDEEDCTRKLLRYLMDHFRLPSGVWKVLDANMHLRENAAKFKENFPADFVNYIVSRCERGEDLDFGLFEGADDAAYDLFFVCYDNCWQALQEGRTDEARRCLDEAAGLGIRHPAMEICRGKLLLMEDKKEEACECMRALYESFPEDDLVGYNTAAALWECGERAEAAELFKRLKEKNARHYMANLRLAEWNYDTGDFTEAKKCAEAVLAQGADDSFMELLVKINRELEQGLEARWNDQRDWEAGLELGWCYLQDGKTSRGLRIAREIEQLVSDEKRTEYTGLRTKLLVEEAEYAEAIDISRIWEEMLEDRIRSEEDGEEKERDRDRVRQAHLIRMQSYKCLGYKEKENFRRAIDEIRAVETGGARDIGLWMEEAQICMELEEYDKSLELARRLIDEYQAFTGAAIAMEVYRRQWDAEGVVQYARLCIQHFPGYIRAYEHLGRVYLDLKQSEKLWELLEEAEKNNIESPYLEAYRYQLKHTPPKVEVLNRRLEEFQKNYQDRLENGETDFYGQGLPVITEYLYWYPGQFMLRRRAAFHKSGMQLDKALEDYEAALADAPGNANIYHSMSNIHVLKGDYERALVEIKKAILYGDEEWSRVRYYYMARIYMLLNDDEQALVWFRHYDGLAEKDGGHLRNMAKCLARLGETKEAVRRLEDYYRKSDGGYYEGFWDSLVNICFLAGDRQKHREVLDLWRKKLPGETLALWIRIWSAASREDRAALLRENREYHSNRGWFGLYGGDKKSAMENFRHSIRLAVRGRIRDYEEDLPDAIFAAILCGEDNVGRKYAKKLSEWLAKVSFRLADPYYERPRARLTVEFLANYYTYTDEQLGELLDRGHNCAVCGFCLMPLCQELEGMRILLLLRQGKEREAGERLARNLKIQPYDEYLQAIRGMRNLEQ